MQPMPASRSHQFGPFRLDAGGRVLYRDGERVALTPKAVDVLIALVAAHDRLVTKDELLQTVWAGTVVEEGTLASHVSMLRKALGAGLIETLPKRGYRFVGQVADDSRIARAIVPPMRTMTFLLTALEDGTACADARSTAAAARHDALLRDAITRHGGNTLRIDEGAFCVAFADASAAVRAAVDAQRTLCAAEDAAIAVRMGLHSGTVEAGEDEDLSGPTLARAARLVAAAQAGQILVTAATVSLLDRSTLPGTEWRDLGDHTLRGFTRPERLYQLGVAGLRSEFLPIRTQEALRTNLPPSLTQFIGRQQALAQIREQLHRSRMVTLVGAGGTGKTRLSLEAAGQHVGDFPDGVWLVELAALTDATLVPGAIAAALGARAEGDTPPMTLIESTLRDQRVLLLLDNCEHVIDEAASAARTLLRALPRLQLLATSRQALGIEGETLYRVPSLTLPGPAESASPAEVLASEAAQLFIDRALAVQPGFALTNRNAAAIAQVCRQLDGIPLALELAAARLTALSVQEIARRIDDRFRLLTGGLRTALPRQRTLRALVDWSYDLLTAGERSVLDALAVFAGSFSLEGAERVAADAAESAHGVLDAIDHLVGKSLLIAEARDGADTRYRLLETIKQYASEKLIESGLGDATRRRHFAYFARLAGTAAKALAGPTALEWLDRLEAEHDNLRAALDWSGNVDPAGYAQLSAALCYFWDTRGHYSEAWNRLGRALTLHTKPDQLRLDALIAAGLCAYKLAHTQRSDDLLSEAITLAQQLGSAGSEAEALLWLACDRMHSQGPDGFEPLLLRALPLARTAGDRRFEALTLMELGRAALDRGQHAEAQSLFLESAKVGVDAGCVIDTPSAIHHAGQCALEQLDFASAQRLLDDALVQHRRIGNHHDAAVTLGLLGQLALNEHRLDQARALSYESLRTFRSLHDPKCGAREAVLHATVLRAMGEGAAALPHAESAAETYRELGFPLYRARALCTVGCIHATLGDGDAARRALFDGLGEQQRATRDAGLPDLLEMIAATHAVESVAPQLLGAAAALRERSNIPLLPSDRTQVEGRHANVRARHPEAAFDRAFTLGRALTRDDAIQAALALQQGS